MILKAVSERCSGCRACLLACGLTNQAACNPKYGALRIVSHFPSPGRYELRVCQKCGVCQEACPVGAIIPLENGFFAVNEDACTGCGICVEKCPEDVIRMISGKGVAFTCVGCGECVRYCPKEALLDGDGEVTRV